MSKIKCAFIRYGRSVVFFVLSMDERFRRKDSSSEAKIFVAKNGVKVISSWKPIIKTTDIFLWGIEKYNDTFMDIIRFKNEEMAMEAINKYKVALADWAENWGGFKDEKPTIEINDNNVEIFEV